ncbi:MAG: serine acetyltransferase [Clostridia bacterium]|nr:serine acetyltransferase [Clostridia bacterium]
MENNTRKLVDAILESYGQYKPICRLDAENILNKQIIIEVLEKVRKLLFPGFFEISKTRSDYIEYAVGDQIEFIEYNLRRQIARALGSSGAHGDKSYAELFSEAGGIVYDFLSQIPKIREYLNTDVQAAFNGDPAATSTDEIIFSYPGLFAITVYRIAHELYLLKVPMIPRIMTEYAHSETGIDIHPGATIGRYFFIDHGTGIVVGETTEIGDNVKIYQGVTLGAKSTRKGQLLRGVKRHPTIGDNVTIYSGTTILGGDTVIGSGATIGGNSFILSSVSAGTTVSVKNPPLEFSGGLSQNAANGEFWDWVI